MAVVATWRGGTARALRLALRMSGDDFAAFLGVSPRGVAKWEAGPSVELALRTQDVLDSALERAGQGVHSRFELLLREVAPLEQAESTVALGMETTPSQGGIRRATPELVGALRRSLQDHYTADNLLGPTALIPVITAYAKTVEQVRRDASGRLLDDLLAVGAGYAEFAGWLAQDAGDLDGATRWYRQASEWAECSGDERMTSFVLTRRAAQAVSIRDGEYAARLAKAAQRGTSPLNTRVHAIAAQTEALGYAIAGNASDVDAALERAAILVESGGESHDGDPSTGRYCEMPLYLAITTAKCQLELGRAEAAVEGFTTVLDALPQSYHRDRGQYLARLAQAYVLAGAPDQACLHAEESLAIAQATGSARTIRDLVGLAGKLGAWASHPMVSTFRAKLAGAVVLP